MKPLASYSRRFKLNFKPKKTDFLKNLHWRCRLNLVKKNDVTLLQKYDIFARSELYGINFYISSFSSDDRKTSVYRISFKSVYFFYFAPPYWIRCFKFLSYEL